MKILLVSCSTRARADSVTILQGYGCNSEIGLWAVNLGLGDVDMDYIRLNDYFKPDGTVENFEEVIESINWADGIVFATPVYFGMPSSLFCGMVELLKVHKVSLESKVVGMVSVGAKRNGGQETTIVYALWELMGLGAIAINDGSPISQFGGVGVAGTLGTMKDDKEGLETCKSLGKRMVEIVSIIKAGNIFEPVRVSILLMKDIDESELPLLLTQVIENVGMFNEVINTKEYNLHCCRGCETCPDPEKKGDYKCRNLKDDMLILHPRLTETNAIIPVGIDMKVIERTRYLRRDNYRFSYHVVHIPHPFLIPIFIKENAILCRKNLLKYTKLITSGKKGVPQTQIYGHVGYN